MTNNEANLIDRVGSIASERLAHGYRVGHMAGYQSGFKAGQDFVKRAKAETIICVGVMGAVIGMLVGLYAGSVA